MCLKSLRPLILASTLFLAGCFVSDDVVFSHYEGIKIPLASTQLDCEAYNYQPDGTAKTTLSSLKLIPAEHGKNTVYVWIEDTDPDKGLIVVFHKIVGSIYVGITADISGGQTIFPTEITESKLTYFQYDGDRIMNLARENDINFKRDLAWKISGDVEAQRTFIVAVVTSKEGSRPVMSCSVKKK